MPWSYDNPPTVAQNWTEEQMKKQSSHVFMRQERRIIWRRKHLEQLLN